MLRGVSYSCIRVQQWRPTSHLENLWHKVMKDWKVAFLRKHPWGRYLSTIDINSIPSINFTSIMWKKIVNCFLQLWNGTYSGAQIEASGIAGYYGKRSLWCCNFAWGTRGRESDSVKLCAKWWPLERYSWLEVMEYILLKLSGFLLSPATVLWQREKNPSPATFFKFNSC